MPRLTIEQEGMLKNIVGKNLKNLIDAMKWSQAAFAEETGISEPALSSYLKGNEGRLPPLDYMVGLCMNEEFKAKGLNLTLDLLISEKFNPKALIQRKYNHPAASRKEVKHGDFLGNYLCYFYDQSKPVHNQDHKLNRELRYGVVSVFDVCESLTGDMGIKAIAAFLKEEDADTAFELKRKLDSIFNYNAEEASLNSRNMAIEEAFNIDGISAYEGAVTFSDHHTFINVQSNVHGDNALIILYSPQKRMDSDYIGGIGSVASIARGRTHMPTAQKIILSKYELGCSREIIAEKLSMSSAEIAQEHEAEAICEFCHKLYMEQDYSMQFDEADKAALIRRRLDQLVRNYVEKNICCVGSVTEDEDKAVFKLIEQYKD